MSVFVSWSGLYGIIHGGQYEGHAVRIRRRKCSSEDYVWVEMLIRDKWTDMTYPIDVIDNNIDEANSNVKRLFNEWMKL